MLDSTICTMCSFLKRSPYVERTCDNLSFSLCYFGCSLGIGSGGPLKILIIRCQLMCFARPPTPGETASLSCTIIYSLLILPLVVLKRCFIPAYSQINDTSPVRLHSGKRTTLRTYTNKQLKRYFDINCTCLTMPLW